jgi:hypothetical protein
VILNGPAGQRYRIAGEMAEAAFTVMLETGMLVQAASLWEDEFERPETFSNPGLIAVIKRDRVVVIGQSDRLAVADAPLPRDRQGGHISNPTCDFRMKSKVIDRIFNNLICIYISIMRIYFDDIAFWVGKEDSPMAPFWQICWPLENSNSLADEILVAAVD